MKWGSSISLAVISHINIIYSLKTTKEVESEATLCNKNYTLKKNYIFSGENENPTYSKMDADKILSLYCKMTADLVKLLITMLFRKKVFHTWQHILFFFFTFSMLFRKNKLLISLKNRFSQSVFAFFFCVHFNASL